MAAPQGDMRVSPMATPQARGARWQPVIGDEGRGVVHRALPADTAQTIRDAVLESSASILSKGAPPREGASASTGLVVGYVQSGKTLSFTTAIALARDNGFQLVVVIAGTSTSLLDQSEKRIRRDLGIDGEDGYLRWKVFKNPTNDDTHRREFRNILQEWLDPAVPPGERATILVTVMKHHVHLRNLIELLTGLRSANVPALVIDDEADQASLNTLVRRGRQSTTYSRLLELRRALPTHSFIQYTATPQAPLLISIIDALSPQFVEVLSPGEDYVGGREIFNENRNAIRVIPQQDIVARGQALEPPPDSLVDALRLYLLGVADGLLDGRNQHNANRSMLVHPSQHRGQHQSYIASVGRILDEWERILSTTAESDPDRVDLIHQFETAYQDLLRTKPEIRPFSEIARALTRALHNIRTIEVNTREGETPHIDWRQSYGWILVGGQAMDRGFTVEGLTVTYMPRPPGVGNADTIQQRGRFFGYKRRYLGLCRVFLEQDTLDAFESYVAHEEEMRAQLIEVRDSGRPLSAWKRAFILSPNLRPCRQNVINLRILRGGFADSWMEPSGVLVPPDIVESNQQLISNFTSRLQFQVYPELADRPLAQRHEIIRGVPLAQVVDELLTPFRILDAEEETRGIGALLQLSLALERNPNETCAIVQISPHYERKRPVDDQGTIATGLFQGPTRLATGGYSYQGDAAFHDESVTVQIHNVTLTQDDRPVATAVPVLAIWIPQRLAVDWIAQQGQ